MKVIRLKRTETPLLIREKNLREENFIPTVEVEPSWLGAISALRLAKFADREHASAIEVTRPGDIIVAISARKIAKNRDIKIIANLQPNSPTPLSLPKEYAEQTDLWVFPSERMEAEFNKLAPLKNTKVILPAYFGDTPPTTSESLQKQPMLLVMLTRKPDSDRLVKIIDAVDAIEEHVELHLLGRADAASVMPAVRHSRHINHPERIRWEGDDNDLPTLLSHARAVVKGAQDITAQESAIYQFGGSVIDIPDISTTKPLAADASETAFKEVETAPETSKFSPETHISELARAIQTL